MKKIATLFLMASAVFAFSSCEDLLNGDPYTSFTKSNYFTSETNVEQYANYFYNTFTGYGNAGGSGDYYFPTLNDNQAVTGLSTWTYTAVPSSSSTWSNAYTEIRRANILIEALPGISAMSDAQKNNWMGIARLYRAWQHYKLVRAYGDCFFVDHVLNVGDESVLYGARQDRDEVMDKILEDLNYAVANITEDASSRVAYNAAVAQAMKSEICLYEGTFCKYRSSADGQKAADATRANKYLTESVTASNAIMSNSMYKLNSSYRANYNSLNLAGNTEMILYKHYVYGTLCHSTIDYTCSSTQQNGMSKAAFDAYLFTDGKPLATTSCDKNDHPELDANGNVSIAKLLAVRDPRLSAQVDPVLMYRGHGYTRFGVGMETTSSTGYGVLKFDNEAIEVLHRNQTGSNETDAPIFWLAEIYLNYAEAKAELGSCTADDLNKSVNLLRTRAGMPAMSLTPEADPANNMNVSNLIWEIRRERRVELMYDMNDRYYSLLRWHQLDKLDTTNYPDQKKGAWVADFKGDMTVDANGYIDVTNSGAERKYEAKQYLYPIATGDLTLNSQLGQNYGW